MTTQPGITRARLLRAALAGSAAAVGGAAIGSRSGGSAPLAAASAAEADILNAFLLLEYLQEDFYRAALEGGRLGGELRELAAVVARQETEHVAFLAERLGQRARERPASDFGDAVGSPDRFRETAVELEEAAIGLYIGQGANLARETVGPIATVVAVEARQAAWARDLAGMSPAPRAADPARTADAVVRDLRDRGFIG